MRIEVIEHEREDFRRGNFVEVHHLTFNFHQSTQIIEVKADVKISKEKLRTYKGLDRFSGGEKVFIKGEIDKFLDKFFEEQREILNL